MLECSRGYRDVMAQSGNPGKEAQTSSNEEGRTIKRYLEALESTWGRRRRRLSLEAIRDRLQTIDDALPDADPLTRVQLLQERLDLEGELQSDNAVDLEELEDGFVAAARSYSERKGISFEAWRSVGVDADLLRRAGIARGRR